MKIILASTSPYRRQLLQRLQLPFSCQSPGTDETAGTGERPAALAQRLALAKARHVAGTHPDALVIGSDQVAVVNGRVLGKPGGHAAACAQLHASSGYKARFYTAVALVCIDRRHEAFHVERFSAQFRRLTTRQIENYLMRQQPYDCAGSFKCEGLGIALVERLEGRDPTSLEGLPLIALTELLERAGIDVLSDTSGDNT